MAFSSTTNKTTGVIVSALPQTVAINWPFQFSSDLLVLDNGASGTQYDPANVLTLGSDYTVTGGGYDANNTMQNGSVILQSGGSGNVQVGDYITILRGEPINQTQSLVSTGPLTAVLIEQILDRQATFSQQLNEIASRCLQFENFETLAGTLNLAARKSNFLAFDSNGLPTFVTSGGVPVYNVTPLVRTQSFSVSSSTTLVNVPGLTLNVPGAGTYPFQANILAESLGAGGYKIGFSGTNVSSIWFQGGATLGSTGATSYFYETSLPGAIAWSVSGIDVANITVNGVFVTSAAGSITFQFAQQASNATATLLQAGSYLIGFP